MSFINNLSWKFTIFLILILKNFYLSQYLKLFNIVFHILHWKKEIRDLTVPSLLPQWWVPLRAFHTSSITTKTIWKPVEATPMLTQTKMKMSHPLIPTLRLRMHLFWIRYVSSLYFYIYLYFLLLVPNLNQYSFKKKKKKKSYLS